MHMIKPILLAGSFVALSLLSCAMPAAQHLATRNTPPKYSMSRDPQDPSYFNGFEESKVNTQRTSKAEIFQIIRLMDQAEIRCKDLRLFAESGKPQLLLTYSEGPRSEGFLIVEVTQRNNVMMTLQELLEFPVKVFSPRLIDRDNYSAGAVDLSVEEVLSSMAWGNIEVLALLRNIADYYDAASAVMIEAPVVRKWFQGVYRALLESDKLEDFKPTKS